MSLLLFNIMSLIRSYFHLFPCLNIIFNCRGLFTVHMLLKSIYIGDNQRVFEINFIYKLYTSYHCVQVLSAEQIKI